MKTLMYPCCGVDDMFRIFDSFVDKADKFIFADLRFSKAFQMKTVNYIKKYGKIIKTHRKGSYSHKWIDGHREVTPEYFHIMFEYNGTEKEVILRRGCAQFALLEQEKDSIDYFVHRGDGSGEGGSGIYFIANLNSNYKPIARLYDKLLYRLKPEGFIISDGSNIDRRFKDLNNFYYKISQLSKKEVLNLLPVEIELPNSKLVAADVLEKRYNHTIMWKVFKDKNIEIKDEENTRKINLSTIFN